MVGGYEDPGRLWNRIRAVLYIWRSTLDPENLQRLHRRVQAGVLGGSRGSFESIPRIQKTPAFGYVRAYEHHVLIVTSPTSPRPDDRAVLKKAQRLRLLVNRSSGSDPFEKSIPAISE